MPASSPGSLGLDRLGPALAHSLGVSFEHLKNGFRPAVAADFPEILSLRRQVIGEDLWWDDEAFVRWRYFDSEYGGDPRPYWVLTKGTEILGAVGLEPVVLVVDGTPFDARRTFDIMVRPELAGRGIGGFMNLALVETFPVTMVTGSNASSDRLIRRTWDHILDLRASKVAIGSRRYLQRRVGSAVSRLLGPPADLLLRLRRGMHRMPPAGWELRQIDAFDASLQPLSRALERPGRIIVRRSHDYLNWRFVRNPRCRYHIAAAFHQGAMRGYVVSRFNERRANPTRQAEIVDCMAGPGDAADDFLPFLLRAAIERLAADGAEVVASLNSAASNQLALLKAGFRPRPTERLPFFVRASAPDIHARLSRSEDWMLTLADFDVE